MRFIYKLFKKDPSSREAIISVTSGLGIAVNLLMASVKVIIGLLVSSIAIVSEGINNAADVFSAVITLIGSKLANKHPDEKHPFGYGRIEYLVSLIISVLIMITGIEMTLGSIKLIFNPEETHASYVALTIVAVSAVIKFILGTYTIKMGKKAGSSALVGVGVDGRNDSFASLITIASVVVFLVFHFSVDAYAGVIISLFIIKAGFEILKETIGDLIGRPGDHDLAVTLYNEIRATDGIISVADMMLHNYGPDAWSGSANVELDHKKTVGEIYKFLHELQLKIMHEHNVIMVFGIYAVDNDSEQIHDLRKKIGTFVKEKEHVKSFHAAYISETEQKIYCDLIVDYKLNDWDALKAEFFEYLKNSYPQYGFELTIETEFV